MTLISIRKIEQAVIDRSVSMKHFIIYLFISLRSTFSLLSTTRYQVVNSAYSVATMISYVSIAVTVLQFIYCYKIVKEQRIEEFARSVIPVYAVISLRYALLIMLPLIIINLVIINALNLEFAYWNVINSSIISLIFTIAFAVRFLQSIRHITNANSVSA